MMRVPSLWLVITSLAVSAISRHLPFPLPKNVSLVEHDVKLNSVFGADTPPLSSPPVSPAQPPEDETDDDDSDDDSDDEEFEPASIELWNKHISKGRSLNCGMCGTDIAAGWQIGDTRTPPSGESRWTGGVAEMVDWFWFREDYGDPRRCQMGTFWGMGNLFRGMGISTVPKSDGGDVECFLIRHGDSNARTPDGLPKDVKFQTYEMEGRQYFVSSAF